MCIDICIDRDFSKGKRPSADYNMAAPQQQQEGTCTTLHTRAAPPCLS